VCATATSRSTASSDSISPARPRRSSARAIGAIVARLLWHLRCRVLAVDPFRDEHLLELGVEYVDLDRLLAESDIVTLNCPLTPETHHLIDAGAIGAMRRGAMLVNTGRGALIDTQAAVAGLKSGQIGSLALDVYEEEAELFFEDRSDEIIDDDVFARLLTFPNVLITAHQAFLTREALAAIAETTLSNVESVVGEGPVRNEVRRQSACSLGSPGWNGAPGPVRRRAIRRAFVRRRPSRSSCPGGVVDDVVAPAGDHRRLDAHEVRLVPGQPGEQREILGVEHLLHPLDRSGLALDDHAPSRCDRFGARSRRSRRRRAG
jgi:hypothetical protein